MIINCFRNNSEPNKLGKNLTPVANINGTLKAETSLIDPVILIDSTMEASALVNYIEIPAFNRKYFVNSMRSIRTGLVEFSCHVDVLDTYAEEILNTEAIINKQENNYNLYLDDSSFKTYSNPDIKTREFPSGFSGHSYIFTVAG